MLRTGLALLSGTGLTWLSSLAMLLVMPRAVGAEGLGIYATALTISGLAGLVAACGMPQVIIREVARRPDEASSIVGHALASRLLIWCALVLLGTPLAFAVFEEGYARLVLGLVVVRSVTSAVGDVAASGLHGLQSLGKFAIFRSALGMVTEFGAVTLLLLDYGIALMVMLGIASAAFRATVAWVLLLRKLTGPWRWSLGSLIGMPRSGLPFLSVDISLLLYGGAGTLLIAQQLGATEVGPFALANRLGGVMMTAPGIVAGAVLPGLAAAHRDLPQFRAILANSLRIVVAGAVPMGAGIAWLAPEFVQLLGGSSDYDAAIPILRITGLTVPLVGLDVILATALIAQNRQRLIAMYTAVMAVASFPLTYLAVAYTYATWSNGGVGAAFVPAILEVAMSSVALYLLRDTLRGGLGAIARALVQAVLCAAAMCALLAVSLPIVGLAGAIALGAVTYSGTALLIGLISWSDIEAVRSALRRSDRDAPRATLPARI